MKIIVYNLNANGTIPDYVIDGGYFAISNNNPSPQDWDLVGIALEEATNKEFVDKEALEHYLDSNNIIMKDPRTDEVISNQIIVNDLWTRMESL